MQRKGEGINLLNITLVFVQGQTDDLQIYEFFIDPFFKLQNTFADHDNDI
jgi:hypothetical protein